MEFVETEDVTDYYAMSSLPATEQKIHSATPTPSDSIYVTRQFTVGGVHDTTSLQPSQQASFLDALMCLFLYRFPSVAPSFSRPCRLPSVSLSNSVIRCTCSTYLLCLLVRYCIVYCYILY